MTRNALIAAFTGLLCGGFYLIFDLVIDKFLPTAHVAFVPIVGAFVIAVTVYMAFHKLNKNGESSGRSKEQIDVSEFQETQLLAQELLKDGQTRAVVSDRFRALGEMASSLAHEINQPLTGIRGMTEHLQLAFDRKWNLDDDKIATKLSRILEQADRISKIIDHIRVFAKEAGTPETRPVSLNSVIGSAIDIFGAQLHYHGIALRVVPDVNLPLVNVNPFSIEEVIFSLVSNARDAMLEMEEGNETDESSPKELRIETHTRNIQEKTWVELLVSDNGCGMDHETQARVFDLFFTTKDPDKGTGLGLSVARSIIEQFDGTIEIASAIGEGATVRVFLPAHTQEGRREET